MIEEFCDGSNTRISRGIKVVDCENEETVKCHVEAAKRLVELRPSVLLEVIPKSDRLLLGR